MSRQKNDGLGRMGGRQKGTPNKSTATVREWVQALLDGHREQIEKDLKKLSPSQRVTTLLKLLDYILPKQQAVSAKIDFSNLSDEQLNEVVNQLAERIEDEGDIE